MIANPFYSRAVHGDYELISTSPSRGNGSAATWPGTPAGTWPPPSAGSPSGLRAVS